MDVLYATTLAEAEAARDAGYEPVECSFNSVSVLGPLRLDHHGALSYNPPVSLQAAHLASDPSFQSPQGYVVTGQPDADAIYALLVLAKEIPPFAPIAEAIADLDSDPVGVNQLQGFYCRIPAFRMQFTPRYDIGSYLEALAIGQEVFHPKPLSDRDALHAEYFEQRRFRAAINAQQHIADDVVFVQSDVDSRDIWHDSFASLVVQFKPASGVITFSGCLPAAVDRLQKQKGRQRATVYQLLGDQGLYSFFPKLEPLLGSGSGGRPTIGGSPRGMSYTYDQAHITYQLLRQHVSQRKMEQVSV
ncbi:MAG: hypothetical protein Q8L34_06510 [Candidatus Woesearchaeota archaeon]|nr:hypothetical protein [Candidatus Woesearchaeota archaeon]